jgi:hypothetical protein
VKFSFGDKWDSLSGKVEKNGKILQNKRVVPDGRPKMLDLSRKKKDSLLDDRCGKNVSIDKTWI